MGSEDSAPSVMPAEAGIQKEGGGTGIEPRESYRCRSTQQFLLIEDCRHERRTTLQPECSQSRSVHSIVRPEHVEG